MTLHSSYIKNGNPVNATDADQSWTYHGEQAVEQSTSFSSTSESVFGIGVSISASAEFDVPFIAKASVTATADTSYEYHTSETNELTTSYTVTVGQDQGSSDGGGLLKPGHAQYCTTTAVQGKYDGGYTATIRISVQGQDFEIERHGDFKGQSWLNAGTECKDMLVIDIPGDAPHIVEAKDSAADKSKVKRALKFVA